MSFPRVSPGMKGNLKEAEGYVVANLAMTGATVLLSVYFLAWQSYVLRADVIINGVLLVVYGMGAVLAFITVARFTRSEDSLDSYQNHCTVSFTGYVNPGSFIGSFDF